MLTWNIDRKSAFVQALLLTSWSTQELQISCLVERTALEFSFIIIAFYQNTNSVSASLRLAWPHLCALKCYGGLNKKLKQGQVINKTNDIMRELSNFTKKRKGFKHGWLCSCHVCRPVGKIFDLQPCLLVMSDLQNTVQRSKSAELSFQATEVDVAWQTDRVIHLLPDTQHAQYSGKPTIVEVICA